MPHRYEQNDETVAGLRRWLAKPGVVIVCKRAWNKRTGDEINSLMQLDTMYKVRNVTAEKINLYKHLHPERQVGIYIDTAAWWEITIEHGVMIAEKCRPDGALASRYEIWVPYSPERSEIETPDPDIEITSRL